MHREVKRVIRQYALTPDETREEFWTGFTREVEQPKGTGWRWMGEPWRDSVYREVWLHEEGRAIFTYCEGDLVLEMYPSDTAYREAVEAGERYYRESE